MSITEFKDRQGTNLNRKRLKIISQTPTEMIVDVERADTPSQEGTPINASVFNGFKDEINIATNTAISANTVANSALTVANEAKSISQGYQSQLNTAVQNASAALSKATNVETSMNNANRYEYLEINTLLNGWSGSLRLEYYRGIVCVRGIDIRPPQDIDTTNVDILLVDNLSSQFGGIFRPRKNHTFEGVQLNGDHVWFNINPDGTIWIHNWGKAIPVTTGGYIIFQASYVAQQ